MTDYNDLITRLRSMDGIGYIQLKELMSRKTPMAAADAIAELVERVSMLESARSIACAYMRAKHALGKMGGEAE